MNVPPVFETVGARRIQTTDLVNRELPLGDRLFTFSGIPVWVFTPAARLTETGGVKMLSLVPELNVPRESLARYTWNASVPGPPLSLWKSAVPVTFTVSMNEDPKPGGRSILMDAVGTTKPGVVGGTMECTVSLGDPMSQLYTSTLKIARPCPHPPPAPRLRA